MDEQNVDPEEVEIQTDKPIDLIPKSVLDFKPRVADLPDLHIDPGLQSSGRTHPRHQLGRRPECS